MKQRIKQVLCTVLTLCMLVGMVPSSIAASGSDITGHWAEDAINSFIEDGYLTGDGNGSYYPDETISRAQYAAIINRVLGLTEESDTIEDYTDVSSDDWYYSDLSKALAAGYMQGTASDMMSPDDPITRAQAFVILARLLDLDTESVDTSVLSEFSDADELASWAESSVAALVAAGYVTGSGGQLLPINSMTRAEGITILYRTQEPLKTALEARKSAAAGEDVTEEGSDSETTYTDGVYTGTGAGYGGTLTLTVTISGGEITSIVIGSNSETSSYLKRAQKLIDQIVSAQSTTGVDTISGATISSKAILTAVSSCLSQASGGEDTSKTGSSGTKKSSSGSSSTKTETGTTTENADGSTTYVGSSWGYGGKITVSVTVSSTGVITEIKVLSENESSSYYSAKNVESKIISAVLSAQTTDGVDTVSGATVSSKALLRAIAAALSQATVYGPDDGVWSVTSYAQFYAAAKGASSGDTISIQNDITDAGVIDETAYPVVTLTADNVTINGSGYSVSSEDSDAFCLTLDGATGVTITDMTFDGAYASSGLGGGLRLLDASSATMNDVTIQNSTAAASNSYNGGGAVYLTDSSTLTATDCSFQDNMVGTGNTGRGGAIYAVNSTLTLSDCTLDGNLAADGGAISVAGISTLSVTECTFGADNDASKTGDDLYLFDGYTLYGTASSVVDSSIAFTLSGNTHTGTETDYYDYNVVFSRYSQGTSTGSGLANFSSYGHDLTYADADRTLLNINGDLIVSMYQADVADVTYYYVTGLTNDGENTIYYLAGNTKMTYDGLTEIGSTGVYYYCSDPYTSEDTLYGVTPMTYAEYYLNEITTDQGTTADDLYTEGLYDAITSATSTTGSHSSNYPTILNYTSGYTDKDYYFKIDGIDTVDVSVQGDKYAEAVILNAVDAEQNEYRAAVASITDVTETQPYAAKALNSDGTYAAQEVVDSSAAIDLDGVTVTPKVSYSSSYGDYQFTMTFTGFDSDSDSDLYYNNFLMNMYAATIENKEGTVAGAVYYEDVWEETSHKYYVDIALANGSFTALEYEFENARFADFFGTGDDEHIMASGDYTVTLKSRGYTDLTATFTVAQKLTTDQTLSVKDISDWSSEGATATVDISALPDAFGDDGVSAALTYGSGRDAATLTEGSDFSYYDGALTISNEGTAGVGSYTLTLTADGYQPASVTFTVSSDLTSDHITITDNVLTISETYSGVATAAAYVAAISSVSVDGTSLQGQSLGGTIFTDSDGTYSINFDATITSGGPGGGTSTAVFSKGSGAEYTLVIAATGYPTITVTVTAP